MLYIPHYYYNCCRSIMKAVVTFILKKKIIKIKNYLLLNKIYLFLNHIYFDSKSLTFIFKHYQSPTFNSKISNYTII